MSSCYRCGRSGHWASACFASTHISGATPTIFSSSSKKSARRDSRCDRCGREGHFASNCYAKSSILGASASQYVQLEKVSTMACFRCGREGHFVEDCYAKTRIDGTALDITVSSSSSSSRSCDRCGRLGHDASSCYANTNVNGVPFLSDCDSSKKGPRQPCYDVEMKAHNFEITTFLKTNPKFTKRVLLTCCWNLHHGILPATLLEKTILQGICREITCPASCTPDVLRQCLPSINIWHFSGHGGDFFPNGANTLGLTDAYGNESIVPRESIVSLAKLHSREAGGVLDLVVLNACVSGDLGRSLVIDAKVPNVICWDTSADDGASLAFCKGLWLALAKSCSFEDAFNSAREAVNTVVEGGRAKYILDIDPAFFLDGVLPDGRIPAGKPIFLTSSHHM